MLPKLPFVVLDMNTCRSEAVVARLLRSYRAEGVSIYLPAIAFWELSKGNGDTVPASLRLLAELPEAVSVARHSYVIKRREMLFRQRVELVDPKLTDSIREVLRGLRDDSQQLDPSTVDAVREHWRRIFEREDHPRVVRGLESIHRRELPSERANAIRKSLQATPVVRSPFQSYLAEAIGGREDLCQFLVGVGYGHVTAKKVISFASISALGAVALISVALRWRVFGGAETARDTLLHNDVVDTEYALLAAYGRGLESADAGARATYDDVLHIAQRLWP